ncbi:MAG: ABC transporter substrate binding protein [Oscillospiraceae bacterium]
MQPKLFAAISAALALCLCFSLGGSPLPAKAAPGQAAESPLRLGYCESDPYVEFDTQLYYLLLGMEEYGLVSGVAGLVNKGMSAAELWQTVSAANAPGWKVNFVKDAYVSLSDSRFRDSAQAGQIIEELIAKNDVALMLTMGTSGGLAIAGLASQTPLVNFVAADPYKAGIVAGTETSGIAGRWAHVDVNAFNRTIEVMADIFKPESVGVVYANNSDAYVYSGADVLDVFCGQNGIAVHRQFVEDEFDEAAYGEYVQQLYEAHAALAGDIDVYILTTSLLEPGDYAYVLEPLFARNIPVYSINSSYDVEYGALLAAESSDFPNIGRFGADALRRYLGGEALEELPQVYQTAPFLVINYSTARKIGYRPSFDMLLSASTIYIEAKE